LAVGDFNGDGKLDLATANYDGDSVSVLLGNGDGSFQSPLYTPLPPLPGLAPIQPTVPQQPKAIVMGDLNGDGKMDLAVTTRSSYLLYQGTGFYGPYYGTAYTSNAVVLLGHGNGTFTATQTIPLTNGFYSNPNAIPVAITAANLNGDNFPDLAVADSNNNTLSVLINAADWSTTPQPGSFAVSGFPSSTTAGVSGNFTVTALNADGTTDTNYTGTVHFSSSDGQAGLPADYTFQASDAGVHTFSAVLKTAGTQSLTATGGSITGSEAGISVTPAAASKMVVAGFPSPTTAGATGYFTVTLQDPYGNAASGYRGTVHFTSSDARAVLPAPYTFTSADAGVHSFSATLKTAGTQSLTATDTTTGSFTSTDGGIGVNPAAASQFIISAPSSIPAGVAFSLTLTVEDAYGNVVTAYTGTVHFSNSDPRATLPANYTFTTSDRGMHTFTRLVLRKKGSQRITITDTHNSALTGSVIVDVL
jgi:hypothetical protein